MRGARVRIAALCALCATAGAVRAAPADLAPGAPELLRAERRLTELLATADAVGAATTRLQAAWAEGAPPTEACDADRTALAARIARFGAAWREAQQAARAQAERVARARVAPTVAPLVDARWQARLTALEASVEAGTERFLEASAWQDTLVRPVAGACPPVALAPAPGVDDRSVQSRADGAPSVAVLALGDGWVCPGAMRADGAVVVVAGEACWSDGAACACAPEPVTPGAVIGPAVPAVPAAPSAATVTGAATP